MKPVEDSSIQTPSSLDIVSSSAPQDHPYSFQHHIQTAPDYEKLPSPAYPSQNTITRPSPLTSLLSKLPIAPSQTAFLPSDEALPFPLTRIPPEILDPILMHLSVADIERFGMTCWRARYLTSGSSVWKRLVSGIYRSPSMVPSGWKIMDAAARHGGEWRTALVEEERIRMDGCYISVCHYMSVCLICLVQS